MRNSKPILLVEDDAVDAMTVKRAFEDLNVTNLLVHKNNGEEALDYLRVGGDGRPCVILLDLNMPRMNGFEFLKEIKADPVLKKIPVVVLTTSEADRNIIESYDLGVAGYIVKEINYKRFIKTIRTINTYWTLNRLPTKYAAEI